MKLSFKLNGKDQNLDIDGEMPLLWVLRDVVKLKGTKFGCGKGLCGACTVHLDNAAIRSCVTPVQFAQGKSVTTIEGLSETNTHPLQKAWLNRSVPQCGYCQPGQIMQAASLRCWFTGAGGAGAWLGRRTKRVPRGWQEHAHTVHTLDLAIDLAEMRVLQCHQCVVELL